MPRWPIVLEAAIFLSFTIFFLLYGLTPILGGDGLGLVGADEPRYAQIAHEMLDRFDSAHAVRDRLSACVTPYLYGHPWLVKPALYYWIAAAASRVWGANEFAMRLPAALGAVLAAASWLSRPRASPCRRFRRRRARTR